MFKQKIINQSLKSDIKTSGSRPGIIYGLPKIHQRETPLRPILSTVGTHNYNLSKYLVTALSSVVDSLYILRDSFSYAKEISVLTNCDHHMASFDIKSLFTNVPVNETIQIILNKLFPNSDSIFFGFNKKLFSKVLQLCTKDNLFLFNSHTFFQIDGVPIGGCVSPTLADIFMGFHEQVWLNNCPSEFKPVFYRRYVDDTFLLFRFPSHIQLFLTYLNSQH